jgi:FAD/FMN-containing dehydrogenase
MSPFTELSLTGRVATPADPDWDQTRLAWNLAADPHPAAVAYVEGADDIAAVIRYAAAHELKVIGQTTGHGAAPVGPVEDTIVIKTERMRKIEIDREAKTARIEAGVQAMELAVAAQEAGLCFLPGSSPNIGVTGYTLGGGLSWLGRRYGSACNRVEAIEIVTADAQSRRVDRESEPELFWALRGGGGSYAIVSALHLRLLPIAEVFGGALVFPAEVGAEAVRTYRDWAATAPEEITSRIRFLRPPPLPDVPEPLRDKPLLTIDGAFVGDLDKGDDLVAPLREIGEPIMDTFARMPVSGLGRIHMDPEPPVPVLAHALLVRELSNEGIDAFFERVGPQAGSPLLLAEFDQLGGALGRPAEVAGALSHLDSDYVMFAAAIPMNPDLGAAIVEALNALEDALSPWAGEGAYLNFAERPSDIEAIFGSAVCDRLAAVKRRWDPDGIIRANHVLSLSSA